MARIQYSYDAFLKSYFLWIATMDTVKGPVIPDKATKVRHERWCDYVDRRDGLVLGTTMHRSRYEEGLVPNFEMGAV